MLWVIHSFLEKDVKYEQNMKQLLIQAEWVCFNNNKTKNPTQYIALKFELERTGFIHFLLQCYLWKEFEVPVTKITLFLDLMKQINSELNLLVPNTELKFAVSCDQWWLKLGLWERLILEKAEVKHVHLNRLGWNCKVFFCLWRKT